MILTPTAKQLLVKGLQHSLRPDLRGMLISRQFTCQFTNTPGGVVVRWGSTEVFAKVTAEIGEPVRGRPNEGSIKFTIDVSVKQDSSKLSVELHDFLNRCFRQSKALDPASLGIISGKAAWAIRCQLVLIADDGGLFDCLLTAAFLSLKDFKKPFVSVEKGEVKIHPEKKRQSLSVSQVLIPFSFGLLSGERSIFMDPGFEEECVMDSRLLIVLNNYKQLVMMLKEGGSNLRMDSIEKVLEHCQNCLPSRLAEIRQFVEKRPGLVDVE